MNMPFDIAHHFSQWTNGFANNSTFSKGVSNPFWFGLFITCVILLIIYIIGWEEDTSIKLILYVLATSVGMIFIHDSVLKSQWDEAQETDSGTELVQDILQSSSDEGIPIEIRPTEQIRTGLSNIVNSAPLDVTSVAELNRIVDASF